MLDQLTLLERLGIFMVRDFLDIPLCRRMLEEVRRAEDFQAGGVFDEDKQPVQDDSARKVLVTRLSGDTMRALTRKLDDLRPQLESAFKVELGRYQGPDFLFYKEGGFYRPHTDRSEDGSEQVKKRRVTVVVFVNGEHGAGEADPADIETYGGGDLVLYDLFRHKGSERIGFSPSKQPGLHVAYEKEEKAVRYGISLNGRPGLLVAFDSTLLHEVKPVTAGERLTIAVWFLEKE